MKYYAAVKTSSNITFVWDKFLNKWIHISIAIPKPLAYSTAIRKCKEEMHKDNVNQTCVVSETEYNRRGFF